MDNDMLFVGDSDGSCRLEYGVDDMARRVLGQLEMAKAKAAVSRHLQQALLSWVQETYHSSPW
jgi:hypothetical protein